MTQENCNLHKTSGFTLIELSIVLVIIGLVIGGILVGQDLISAAAVRSQIAQIEKYNAAVNTFRSKYNGQLPGDMDVQNASMFSMTPRVVTWNGSVNSYSGSGDGDGTLMGNNGGAVNGHIEVGGETLVFWQDLSTAGLIDGSFSGVANSNTHIALTTANINQYFPTAKIGNGNSIFVWSGGYGVIGTGGGPNFWHPDNLNYFAIAVFQTEAGGAYTQNYTGMTVAQAYAIDTKVDDGLPQYGNVMALCLGCGFGSVVWAANPANGGDTYNWFLGYGDAELSYAPAAPGDGVSTPARTTTCYDTSAGGGYEKYSMGQKSGSGINCALAFKFQ